MWTTCIIYLFFGNQLFAESITASVSTSTTAAPDFTSTDANTPSAPFDVDAQLVQIEQTCLSIREQEQLSGDIVRYGVARFFNANLIKPVLDVIGLSELRSLLHFAPLGPWTNFRQPSREETEAAITVEEYYELSEPRSKARSLDNVLLFEKNLPPSIAFLDRRIPEIRAIYRFKFAAIRRRPDAKVTIDREEVDRLIDVFITTSDRIHRAFQQIFLRNHLCMFLNGIPIESWMK